MSTGILAIGIAAGTVTTLCCPIESGWLNGPRPANRTWRLQSDGSYRATLLRRGRVQPAALPNVSIELDALFPA